MKLNFLNFFNKQNSSVGLDISDRSIKVLSLKRKKDKSLGIEGLGYGTIEDGVVENGNILQPEKLAEIISQTFQETVPQPIQSKKILLAIPDSRTFIDIYKISASIIGKDLEKTIRDLASKSIPLEPETLYFDFREIGFDKKTNEKEYLYVASPKETIDGYKKMLEFAGIEPLVFEFESASLARALIEEKEKTKSIMIFDMGSRTTKLSIAYQGEIVSSAVVNFGGNKITKIVAQNLKLSFEEADRLKISMGLNNDEKENEVRDILQSFCPPVIGDVISQIDYYEKNSGKIIDEIIICGGSSLIADVDKCLSEKVGKIVRKVNPWGKAGIAINSESDKIFNKEAPILFATVIGLALRGLEANPQEAGINLSDFNG